MPITSNFSFSHSVFYPVGELSTIFIKYEIVVCKLFQFGRGLNDKFRGLKQKDKDDKAWNKNIKGKLLTPCIYQLLLSRSCLCAKVLKNETIRKYVYS